MNTSDLLWVCIFQFVTSLCFYFHIRTLVMTNPPVKKRTSRSEKRAAKSTKRTTKRRLALKDDDSGEFVVTNTISTDISALSMTDTSSIISVTDQQPLPEELIALEAMSEWDSRPISHRPPLEKVATFISEMYLSLPYGTTDVIELSLSPANCRHLYRAFHTIRKECLFTALHIMVTVQSTISSRNTSRHFEPLGENGNAFDSPTGHDLRTYYGNIFNHVSTIRAASIPPRAALSVLLCDLSAFLNCHKNNVQLFQSAIMTELMDGYIIYLTKMLTDKAELELVDIKRQLYEARLLNRFAESIMLLFEDHTTIMDIISAKCRTFNLQLHGIKELAPFCFEPDARLVRVAPQTKLFKLAPKYLADIIKNNDVFCTAHNIPYHLFITRTSPFTAYENILSLVKPDTEQSQT